MVNVFSLKRPISEAFYLPMQEAKRRRVDDQSTEMLYAIQYREQLIRFSKLCIVCHIHGRNIAHHPSILHCPTLQSMDDGKGVATYKEWKKSIRYTKSAKVCFWCNVPQGPKDYLHDQFQVGKNTCKFPDLIAPLAFAVFFHTDLRASTNARFNNCMESLDTFSKWVVSATPVGGHLTNLSALFLSYASEQ
jgi:hypothetical protein